MADRSVEVRLRADISQFQRAMMQAGASAKGLFSNLETADTRMSNLVQTSMALGPALVPIGATAVPAVAGLATQLGFAASAAATTVIAFNGVGDALDALNDYKLDPTAANMQKMHEAMATLGPAGQDFVRFLQSVRPQMQGLQDLTQAGLFPGVEDGINELLELLPLAQQHLSTVSATMGDLARDAGDNLNDDRWRNFFEFLNAEAAPTLQAMGRTLGNVVEGLANMIMEVDPLTDMFTGGMLQASRDFRQWSEELGSSQGFQSFVDYIRDNGPQAMETLGAIAKAVLALVQAAAPVGAMVLPVLEALADVLTAVASSPAGPVLVSAAAGFAAISRAIAVYNAANGSALMGLLTGIGGTGSGTAGAASGLAKMNMAISGLKVGIPVLGALALSMSDLDEKAGLSNTAMLAMMGLVAGPWGAALGGAVGLTMDLAAANDGLEDAVGRVQDAFSRGDAREQEASLESLRKKVEETEDGYNGLLNAIANRDPGAFAGGLLDAGKSAFLELTGATDSARDALDDYSSVAERTQGLGTIMAGGIGASADAFKAATQSAEEFYDSLNKVNALLDKRAALRAARDAVRDFNSVMEEGPAKLKRGTAAWDAAEGALENIADTSLVAAGHLKGMARVNFIDNMRDQFVSAAVAMGIPIQRAETLATRLGLLDKQRPTPKVDADTGAANQKLTATERQLLKLWGINPNPKVSANTSAASAAIAFVTGQLNALDGKTATTYVRTMHTTSGGKQIPVGGADGMTVPGQRHPYGDKVLAFLAPGEEVITNRNGEADRFRRDRAMGLIPAYANGGGPLGGRPIVTSGTRQGGSGGRPIVGGPRSDGSLAGLGHEANEASKGAKSLKERLKEATKELERETEKRRALREKIDSFKSEVRGSFNGDIFGNGLAGLDTQLQADRNDARSMKFALAKAKAKGLSGGLFEALAASGDLTTAQQLAGLSRSEIAAREKLFSQTKAAQSGLANFAAAGMEKAYSAQTKVTDRLEKTVTRLEKRLDKIGKDVEKGARDGIRDRNRDASQRSRAGR